MNQLLLQSPRACASDASTSDACYALHNNTLHTYFSRSVDAFFFVHDSWFEFGRRIDEQGLSHERSQNLLRRLRSRFWVPLQSKWVLLRWRSRCNWVSTCVPSRSKSSGLVATVYSENSRPSSASKLTSFPTSGVRYSELKRRCADKVLGREISPSACSAGTKIAFRIRLCIWSSVAPWFAVQWVS